MSVLLFIHGIRKRCFHEWTTVAPAFLISSECGRIFWRVDTRYGKSGVWKGKENEKEIVAQVLELPVRLARAFRVREARYENRSGGKRAPSPEPEGGNRKDMAAFTCMICVTGVRASRHQRPSFSLQNYSCRSRPVLQSHGNALLNQSSLDQIFSAISFCLSDSKGMSQLRLPSGFTMPG